MEIKLKNGVTQGIFLSRVGSIDNHPSRRIHESSRMKARL